MQPIARDLMHWCKSSHSKTLQILMLFLKFEMKPYLIIDILGNVNKQTQLPCHALRMRE